MYAILDHMGSTDSKPNHLRWPQGPSSWCGYNRNLAVGKTDYIHKDPLPEAIVTKIRPIFDRLSDSKLLEKCLDGFTQNACESFNSTVWMRCPKERYVGASTVNVAVYDAVCTFNGGRMSLVNILSKLGVRISENGKSRLQATDGRRVTARNKKN